MALALIGLLILVAVLLVLIVLAQNAKGGVGGQFGGGGVSSAVGVKKGADLLEKLTWGFAIFIMVGSVLVNILMSGGEVTEEVLDANIEAAKSKNVAIPAPQPATPEAPAEAAPQEESDELDLSE